MQQLDSTRLTELQKFGILVSRIPDTSGRKSGHLQIIASNLSEFGIKKPTKLLIHDTFQLLMNKIERKTCICSNLCDIS